MLGCCGVAAGGSHSETTRAKAAVRADYAPTPSQLEAAYVRADTIGRLYSTSAFMIRLEPHWLDQGKSFWYRQDNADGTKEFILVDSASGAKSPAFDHAKLATALTGTLGHQVDPARLPLTDFTYSGDRKSIDFGAGGQGYHCDLTTYAVTPATVPAPRRPRRGGGVGVETPGVTADKEPQESPDGKSVATIVDGKVVVKLDGGKQETFDFGNRGTEFVARVEWSPDSQRLVAISVTPGDHKPVYLIQSSPPEGGRARLITRPYDLPGDKVDTFDLNLLDLSSGAVKPVQVETIDYDGMPRLRWTSDHEHFTYEKLDRGYGRWRIIEVDAATGQSQTLVDDHPATFFDTTSEYSHYCESGEIIWRSERDGWGHLYLTDKDGKLENQITKGAWVVRAVDKVDEKARQIVFQASGMNDGEDPYFIHYYRVNFDGTGLVCLTPAPGNHVAQFSPDGETLVDTYSTVTTPQVHELRSAADGRLIATLAKADISKLVKLGWKPPEVFVAKGRDGKTDIWGIACWPSNFNPHKRYPIVENIYAGPQDSYVPKSFAPYNGMQSMAELGFVVVQMDGMGTRNRSKAFQDVCYKNLADAGFPDRILWMKALAAKHPQIDISRVGVYGTSAGGQNSTGAVLFHPEFYKVAVSSCGCQDNRMDKIWWNEAWMGWPIGPHYAANSNVVNAHKLQGKLLLTVGEMDHNVDPASTMQVVDALIRADKDFDLIVFPGADHGGGGAYAERRRRDFFVRHLLAVEPRRAHARKD